MIQCPICQMVNDDQTRFCSECGARLGPAPSAQPALSPPTPPGAAAAPPSPSMRSVSAVRQASQARTAPPAPAQPEAEPAAAQAPPTRLHSPMLSGAGQTADSPPAQSGSASQPGQSQAEIDRLKKMASRPEVPQTNGVPRNPFDPRNDPRNQPPPRTDYQPTETQPAPERPVKKLRSPLLASDEDFEDDIPGPGPISARMRSSEPKPRSNGGSSSGRHGLHSPLLGDAAGSDEADMPSGKISASGRQHLHSPLLGDTDDEPEPDAGAPGSRGHLHSPLLGAAADRGPHPAREPGIRGKHHLHSPLLGSSDDDDSDNYYEDKVPEARRGGLHSPILQGGGRGQGLRSPILGGASEDYYEDEYEEDPYAYEDNPNVLRSPLLSSKIDEEHRLTRPSRTEPAEPEPNPEAAPAQAKQNAEARAYSQNSQRYEQAANPPVAPVSPPPSAPAYSREPYGQPSAPQAYQTTMPAGQPETVYTQAEPTAETPSESQADRLYQAEMPAAPDLLTDAAARMQQYVSTPPPDVQPDVAASRTEAFPDMSQFRRGAAGAPPPANPDTVVPVSLPMTAGIPEPLTYVPPELAPADLNSMPGFASVAAPEGYYGFAETPAAAVPDSQLPPASQSAFVPPAAQEPPASAAASEPDRTERPVARTLSRSGSRMLTGDYEEPENDLDSQPSRFNPAGSLGRSPAPHAPAQPASPLPRGLGALAVMLALLKMPLLMSYLPSIMNPQFTWQVVDLAATTFALLFLGLAVLMSRN